MCDCYTDYCADCKMPIPMHLGDFRTARFEIQVFCWRCWETPAVRRNYEGRRHVIWKICDAPEEVKREFKAEYEAEADLIGKFIVVVPLTENAWENRNMNHPNLFLRLEMVERFGRRKESGEKEGG